MEENIMSRYAVEVKEILKRTIIVKAENRDEALRKVEDAYDDEYIVLDSEDYDDTEIELSPYFGGGSGEVSEKEDVSKYEYLEDISE
jgi:hypothetical protein